MAHNKRKWCRFLRGLTILCLVLLVLLFPIPKFTTTGVHPAVANLKRPYRLVLTEYYLDGGSIGLLIIDGQGKTNLFALPVAREGPTIYTNFAIGTTWLTKTNTIPRVPLDEPTRRYFAYLIEFQSWKNIDQLSASFAIQGNTPRNFLALHHSPFFHDNDGTPKWLPPVY